MSAGRLTPLERWIRERNSCPDGRAWVRSTCEELIELTENSRPPIRLSRIATHIGLCSVPSLYPEGPLAYLDIATGRIGLRCRGGTLPRRSGPDYARETFGATHNFLWLLDKRLRIRYV